MKKLLMAAAAVLALSGCSAAQSGTDDEWSAALAQFKITEDACEHVWEREREREDKIGSCLHQLDLSIAADAKAQAAWRAVKIQTLKTSPPCIQLIADKYIEMLDGWMRGDMEWKLIIQGNPAGNADNFHKIYVVSQRAKESALALEKLCYNPDKWRKLYPE